jgi:hypothetical protein
MSTRPVFVKEFAPPTLSLLAVAGSSDGAGRIIGRRRIGMQLNPIICVVN